MNDLTRSIGSGSQSTLPIHVVGRLLHRVQERRRTVRSSSQRPDVTRERVGRQTRSEEAAKGDKECDSDSSDALHRVAPATHELPPATEPDGFWRTKSTR